ncbi:hypothetical protein [Salinisphaera japonica]|uniref:DUF2946 domain-containing protein n=1 Tax=Salinisphaera japonica YTM-1 TaxID=1209778 RepID=A0A423PFN2_9GAMM|nr:hypothetical protein [Salinisphaera japonica]ROO24398.1 hypothetical protein SAJA_13990 [Salinisphaera japonica YTM-1]
MRPFSWPIATWLIYGLAFCLACNALLWSAHDLTGPGHGQAIAGAFAERPAADGTQPAVTQASSSAPDVSATHCGHAELHHLGIVSPDAVLASAGKPAHVAYIAPSYTSVVPQPPITPPIA